MCHPGFFEVPAPAICSRYPIKNLLITTPVSQCVVTACAPDGEARISQAEVWWAVAGILRYP